MEGALLQNTKSIAKKTLPKIKVRSHVKLSKAQTMVKFEPKTLSWFCCRNRRDVKTAKKSGKGKRINGSAQAMLATEWISAKQKIGKAKKSLDSHRKALIISNFESQSYSNSQEFVQGEEIYDEEKDFFIEPPNFIEDKISEFQKALSAQDTQKRHFNSPEIPQKDRRYARSMSSGLNQFMTESRESEDGSSSTKMQLMQRISKDTKNPELGQHSEGLTQEANFRSILQETKCIYKPIDFSQDCGSMSKDQKVNPQSEGSSSSDSSDSSGSDSNSGSTSSSATSSQSSSRSCTTSKSKANSQSYSQRQLVLVSERSTQERCNSCCMLDQHLDSMIHRLPQSSMCDMLKQILIKMQQVLNNNLGSSLAENSINSGVSGNFATCLRELFEFELLNIFDDFVNGILQNERHNAIQSQTEDFDQVTENALTPQGLEFMALQDHQSTGHPTQRFSSHFVGQRLSDLENSADVVTQNIPLKGVFEFQDDMVDSSLEDPATTNIRNSNQSQQTLEVGQGLLYQPISTWCNRLEKMQSCNDGDMFTTANSMSNQGPFNLSPGAEAINIQQMRDSSYDIYDLKRSPTPKFSTAMPFQLVPRQSRTRAYTSPQIDLGGESIIDTRSDLSSSDCEPTTPAQILDKYDMQTPITLFEQEAPPAPELVKARTTLMKPKIDMCSSLFKMALVEEPEFLLPPPAKQVPSQLNSSSLPFYPTKVPSFSNFDKPECPNYSPQLNYIGRQFLQSLDLKKCRPLPQEPMFTVPEPPEKKPDEGLSIVRVERKALTRKTRNNGDGLIFTSEDKIQNYQYQKFLEQNRYERLFLEQQKIGQGGFGSVFKVQHCLDMRTYAIKKIRIHLGLNQDFKMHSVYREILAISQVQHENVVRYHACWIEAVQPNHKMIDKVVKKVEVQSRCRFKDLRQLQKEFLNTSYSGEDSLLDVQKLRDKEWCKNEQNYKFTGKPFRLNQENMDILDEKYQGMNLLKVIEDDQDPLLDEEWSNQIEQSGIEKQKKRLQFDDSSSETTSHESCEEIKEDSYESEDEPNSVGSLYQLVDQGQDFLTLEVMIQMEYCLGDTLRAFLDSKDYKSNRKVTFHIFKQLILGLRHIHEEGLIHRDIKPANVFIDKSRLQLKIGDFGLAKESKTDLKRSESLSNLQALDQSKQPQKRKTVLKQSLAAIKQMSCQNLNEKRNEDNERIKDASFCAGTPMYQAPEQLKRQEEPLSDKVDMYAAGLILMELCCAFKSQHQRILAFHSLKTLRTLDLPEFEHMQEEKQIILRLTEANSMKRLSASHLLDSEIFQNWQFESKQ